MAKRIYTDKQLELLRLWQQEELKRLTLLEGSVRSGKTWISLVLWSFWVASAPKEGRYLMAAKTLTSLRRNCLDLLEQLVGTANFTFSLPAKEGTLFGRKIYFEGANDARAENKIRGMTLYGAYCDELTLFPEDFFAMLLTRLSAPNAKLIATTNPDSPYHWVKEKYIDRAERGEIDMLTMKFLIDENTFLDADYIENQKKEHIGVFYDRFILGQWVVAEGLIYRLLADTPERFMIDRADVPPLRDVTVGEDFGGNKSGHAVVCSGINDGVLYFMRAAFKPAKGTTASELVDWSLAEFDACFKDIGVYFDVYADSAEQVLINSIGEKSRFKVYNSLKLPIVDRIRALNLLLATDRVRFVRGTTEELVKALSSAAWDEKSMADKRLDNGSYNNDIIDAAEYSFEYHIDRLVRT